MTTTPVTKSDDPDEQSGLVSSPELLFEASAPPKEPSRAAREALAFAFARGTSEADLLAPFARRPRRSSVDPKAIEDDLFLDELIQSSFVIHLGERTHLPYRPSLRRFLLEPPTVLGDILIRQEALQELTCVEAARSAIFESFSSLHTFVRALYEASGLTSKGAVLRRRIHIMQSMISALRSLAMLPVTSRSLKRLSVFGEAALRSRPLIHVEQLLCFEEAKTVIDARLKVGADGSLRHVDIMRTTEAHLPLRGQGPMRRFLRSLLGIVRGYRFSDEDILSQLIENAFASVERLVCSLIESYLSLEFLLASLSFRDRATKAGLPTCLAQFGGSARRYEALWNPWLLGAPRPIITTSVSLSRRSGSTILTGPNSGGKTRFLQAIAITQLLGQAGVFVPAAHAELVLAPQMFFSLIERPTAESDEGRLGLELRRIRSVFERCGPSSLIVMDELCSGTNPSEGEEIFTMVLELFEELSPAVFVSTHFLDFAARLAETRRESAASFDFLQVELDAEGKPTFRFVPGVAKTSLAGRTAERLGVTRDELHRLAAQKKRNG